MIHPEYVRDPDTAAEFDAFLKAFRAHLAPIAYQNGFSLETGASLFVLMVIGETVSRAADAAECEGQSDDGEGEDKPWKG